VPLDSKRKVSPVFKNKPQGSRLRGRPETDGGIMYTNINRRKITNWEKGVKNKADWKKSIKDAKVRMGL
jgi:hypothetical protein